MAKDRTLKAALSRHKGIDHQKERQKKLRKQAEKQRRAKQPSEDAARGDKIGNAEEEKEAVERGRLVDQDGVVAEADRREAEGEGWETDESEDAADEDEEGGVDLDTFEEESESESEEESFTTAASNSSKTSRAVITSIPADRGEIDDTEVRDEGENDIPLSDLDVSDADADIIPHQRLTINNTAALTRSLRSFALPSHLPFSATQTITSSSPSTIPDIDDDLNRELAFYKQCLDAVREARILLKREGVPFTRPADYFAEMVKSEEQMGRVRAKVLDAAARSKASADARRQRDLKKFGKAVQVARAQERAREKKEVMGRIESLKRKRQGADLTSANEDDPFDVALEDAAVTERRDRDARRGGNSRDRAGPSRKRQKKDEKFGFGGKKRFAKSNDARSAGDMKGYSVKRMKSGSGSGGRRLGKSRRAKRV